MKEKLAFTHFSTLEKWYIEQYLRKELQGKFPMLPLSKILQPRKERISSQEYSSDIPLVSKIRFVDGKIFYRTAKPKNDVFLAKKNDLLVSNINFEKGAFCIIDKDLVACSTDYQPYQIIYNEILPQYLNLCLRCNVFLENVAVAKPKGMKVRAKWEFIKTFSIPVPSIEEQNELLAQYNERLLKAELIKDDCSYYHVEQYIENHLMLNSISTERSNSMLNFTEYSELFTWDVRNRSDRKVFQTSKYVQKPLKFLAEINPSLTKKLKDDDEVTFIPMECVSDLDGNIKERRTCKAEKKGFTKFENGDVIWAKITPCMQNGKSAVVCELKNGVGYGSTEFYVIRTNKDALLPEYLHYLLRMHRVREEAVNYFSGSAGQQRVRKSFLEELSIPLPSLEEQRLIVEQLDEIKSNIIANRDKTENLYKQAKQDFECAIFKAQNVGL